MLFNFAKFVCLSPPPPSSKGVTCWRVRIIRFGTDQRDDYKHYVQNQNPNIAKAQRTRGWVLLTKVTNFFLVNFLHKSWSNLIFRILIKHQPKHLNQTSAVVLNFNFKILTKPSLRISTRIKIHNLNQASAAKYWPNFSFKILPGLQLQYLDQHQQQ